jgi:hypothetical protein
MTAPDLETEMSADPNSGCEIFERRIAAKLASAGYRLRYDKVALRLIIGIRDVIDQELPQGQSVIFAIAAPIRHPAKTIAAVSRLLLDAPAGELRATVHGNEVRARFVGRVSTDMPGVMGFVHNPERDAGLILDLAESSFNGH